MKSTAPRFRASSVDFAPSVVSELTISTGSGISFMMMPSAVRPSMPGISMSMVTRSGLEFTDLFDPVLAVPRCRNHLDLRIGLKHHGKRLPHECGIIDDDDD